MGSPEKPLDVEMGDMSDETKKLNPDVKTENGVADETKDESRFTGLKKEELLGKSFYCYVKYRKLACNSKCLYPSKVI